MTTKTHPIDVGIIVGRFQIHELHEAHRELIDGVRKSHDRVIIFVGLSPLRNTPRDPLDFNSRKIMIQETYPDVEVYYIDDTRDDEIWSKNLDREITKWLKPYQKAILYGSRDSFIPAYSGKYPTKELESTKFISGTEIRRRISNHFFPTIEFRAGAIASSMNQYPKCLATVDVAIINHANGTILLGQKENEQHLRFIGGFSEPTSESYEVDARRETLEETGLEVDNIQYVGSKLIDDWRFRSGPDKIKTLFFTAAYTFGRPNAADDIKAVQWVSLLDLLNGKIQVMPEHIPLVQMLNEHLIKSKI